MKLLILFLIIPPLIYFLVIVYIRFIYGTRRKLIGRFWQGYAGVGFILGAIGKKMVLKAQQECIKIIANIKEKSQ